MIKQNLNLYKLESLQSRLRYGLTSLEGNKDDFAKESEQFEQLYKDASGKYQETKLAKKTYKKN